MSKREQDIKVEREGEKEGEKIQNKELCPRNWTIFVEEPLPLLLM